MDAQGNLLAQPSTLLLRSLAFIFGNSPDLVIAKDILNFFLFFFIQKDPQLETRFPKFVNGTNFAFMWPSEDKDTVANGKRTSIQLYCQQTNESPQEHNAQKHA